MLNSMLKLIIGMLILIAGVFAGEVRAETSKLSPILEMKLRPLVRALALQEVFLNPAPDQIAPDFFAYESSEEIAHKRLLLAEDIDHLPANYPLQAPVFNTLYQTQLAWLTKKPIGYSADRLFVWGLEYLAKVANDDSVYDGLFHMAQVFSTHENLEDKMTEDLTMKFSDALEGIERRRTGPEVTMMTHVKELNPVVQGILQDRVAAQVRVLRDQLQKTYTCNGLLSF